MTGSYPRVGMFEEGSPPWEYYTSSTGADPIAKAIKKAQLSTTEKARLVALLERIRNNTVMRGDIKHLKGEVWEARLDGENRIFRLLYARSRAGGSPVLLGLVFFGKKTRKTPPGEIRSAVKRLKEWESR